MFIRIFKVKMMKNFSKVYLAFEEKNSMALSWGWFRRRERKNKRGTERESSNFFFLLLRERERERVELIRGSEFLEKGVRVCGVHSKDEGDNTSYAREESSFDYSSGLWTRTFFVLLEDMVILGLFFFFFSVLEDS